MPTIAPGTILSAETSRHTGGTQCFPTDTRIQDRVRECRMYSTDARICRTNGILCAASTCILDSGYQIARGQESFQSRRPKDAVVEAVSTGERRRSYRAAAD